MAHYTATMLREDHPAYVALGSAAAKAAALASWRESVRRDCRTLAQYQSGAAKRDPGAGRYLANLGKIAEWSGDRWLDAFGKCYSRRHLASKVVKLALEM